jgi:hypothetical protein
MATAAKTAKSPFATENDFDAFTAPKPKVCVVYGHHQTALKRLVQLRFILSPPDVIFLSLVYCMLIAIEPRADTLPAASPEGPRVAYFCVLTLQGDCVPRNQGLPYAVEEGQNSYTSCATEAFGNKGGIFVCQGASPCLNVPPTSIMCMPCIRTLTHIYTHIHTWTYTHELIFSLPRDCIHRPGKANAGR